MEKVELQVEGMTCSSCANNVSKALEKNNSSNVFVDFITGEVSFQKEEYTSIDTIIKDIKRLGYQVKTDKKHTSHSNTLSNIEKKFLFSILFTMPLLLHMFNVIPILNNDWVQLILCLPVFMLGVLHFGKSAWGAVRSGTTNMDVLIFIGSTAAFGYSLYGSIYNLGHHFLFYETTASIISFVLLGNVIEHRSVKRTTSSIQAFTELQPDKATVITSVGGKEQQFELDIARVMEGDTILVNTGDQIPLDGTIIWGEATIDESMITGESIPATKEKGDTVIGGTILQQGAIHVQVIHTVDQSTVNQIIELVKEVKRQKPSIQRLADRISAVFVPVVLGISLVTFLVSYILLSVPFTDAFIRSIAVLVISCPCAMGLATPTAVMVGIGKAARKGILIKGGDTLEKVSQATQIVFDKTGTLTDGSFKINTFHNYSSKTDNELKSIIYELEKYSSHPIALSLQHELKPFFSSSTLTHMQEIKGLGMQATDNRGNIYAIGSKRLLNTCDKEHDLYLLQNKTLMAGINIEDSIKQDAKKVIEQLKKQHLKPILLSGDQFQKCKWVANQLGIEEFYAEQRPEEKLQKLDAINDRGHTIMVGDGINDAPALEKAFVGISFSEATDAARTASQIVLLRSDLTAIVEAIRISKQTVSTIKQNLFWAFFYNVLAIPIAGAGLLRPMIAALSMAFSDVIVVGNSIRLRFRK